MKAPRLKRIRRLGTPLPGLTRKEPAGRGASSSERGDRGRRRTSDFRRRLEEKQKVRWHYGISEGQLRSAFSEGAAAAGATGANLLSLLERRLDSVVFRLGLAPTIPAARQLVGHGHVRVNGERVNRAGYRVSRGDEVTITPRARQIPDVLAAVEHGPPVRVPQHLALDPHDPFRGRVVALPDRSDVPFIVDETAIVEYYAR